MMPYKGVFRKRDISEKKSTGMEYLEQIFRDIKKENDKQF